MCVSDLLCVSQLKTNATQLLTFQVSFLTWIPPFCERNAFYWLKRRIIPIAFVFVTFTTQKPQPSSRICELPFGTPSQTPL